MSKNSLDVSKIASRREVLAVVKSYIDINDRAKTVKISYDVRNKSLIINVDGSVTFLDYLKDDDLIIQLCNNFGFDWRRIVKFDLVLDAAEDIPLFEFKSYPMLPDDAKENIA